MDRAYRAKEVSEIYGLHVNTVYRLGKEGKLNTVRVGGSVRYILPEIKKGEEASNEKRTLES